MRHTYPKYYSWSIYFLIAALLVVSSLMLTRALYLYQILVTVAAATLLVSVLILYDVKIRRFSLTLTDRSVSFDSWRGRINVPYDQITISIVRPFRMQVIRLQFKDGKIDLDRNMTNYAELLEGLKSRVPSSRSISGHRLPFVLRLSIFDAYLGAVLAATPILIILYFTQNAAPYFKATNYYVWVIAGFVGLTGLFSYLFLKMPLRFHFYENRIEIDCVGWKHQFRAEELSDVRMDDFGTKGRQIVLKFGRKKFNIMEQRTGHLFEGLYDLIYRQYHAR